MTLNLSYDQRVFSVWFCAWQGGDLLGAITRGPADPDWTGRYRFRHYSPESKDPFDDKDTKDWYQITGPDPETLRTKLVTDFERFSALVGLEFVFFEELLIRATGKEAMAALKQCKWAHGRQGVLD